MPEFFEDSSNRVSIEPEHLGGEHMVIAKTRLQSLAWCGLRFILTRLLPPQEAQATLITRTVSKGL